MEALMKLKPELVVTWTSRPENIIYMEQKGLKVYSIYPESLEELYEVIRFHGKIFNKEKRAQIVMNEMERTFNLVRKRVSDIPPERKQKVLWVGSRPTSVACAIGVNNDIIGLTGGMNPAAEYQQRSVDVSIEKIIAWNPDVIFIWGNAKYSAGDIMNNPQWRFVKAVKNKRVYKAPEWSTWSPRLAPVVLWMASKTYPERFQDVNITKDTDAFFRKVFGIPFSKVKGFAG
jgi:iron complex transport system substrate-binding protein